MRQLSAPLRLLEHILLLFCRPVANQPAAPQDPAAPLAGLLRDYPSFAELVRSKRVADYGCGSGHQSIALAEQLGCVVLGVDTSQKALDEARSRALRRGFTAEQLLFSASIPPALTHQYDVVISHDSFEHFLDPGAAVDEMLSLLREGGQLLITFGPPWYSPRGSHMSFFCALPWVNLLFPERVVMSVRRRYRSDGAVRYEDVESGLNRMTLSKFERTLASRRLKVEFARYHSVLRLDWLSRVPLVRELVVNKVSVIASRALAPRAAGPSGSGQRASHE